LESATVGATAIVGTGAFSEAVSSMMSVNGVEKCPVRFSGISADCRLKPH